MVCSRCGSEVVATALLTSVVYDCKCGYSGGSGAAPKGWDSAVGGASIPAKELDELSKSEIVKAYAEEKGLELVDVYKLLLQDERRFFEELDSRMVRLY